jgi:hypothetical protein
VLEVEPGRLDVLRFERLAAEGADALAAGRCRQAASTLRAALGLWHGPALAEFAYEPFAQGDIARVDELRLGALHSLGVRPAARSSPETPHAASPSKASVAR